MSRIDGRRLRPSMAALRISRESKWSIIQQLFEIYWLAIIARYLFAAESMLMVKFVRSSGGHGHASILQGLHSAVGLGHLRIML